jgi:hypothetical protein
MLAGEDRVKNNSRDLDDFVPVIAKRDVSRMAAGPSFMLQNMVSHPRTGFSSRYRATAPVTCRQ